MKHKIIFIVGPTAVGKSRMALELASLMPSEIVACDAMQVYQEVMIASDKPSPADREQVPHHAIDCVSVTQDYDVAQYRKTAISAIEDILKRGKMPVVVGGSGMYMAILLDGIFENASEDPMVRLQLREDAKVQGTAKLHARLNKVDPDAARKISPHDERRVIRALEVYLTTRKPISQIQKNRQGLWRDYDIKIFALNRERAELYERVNQRVEEMFARGLVAEVTKLKAMALSRNAQSLIGIPEISGYLAGEYDLSEAKEKMKMNTRHYVKRQLTWFRRDQRLKWITIHPQQDYKNIAQEIYKEIANE